MRDRRFLIAGNWKMNDAPQGFDAKDSPYRPREDFDVAVFPTFLDLQRCLKAGLHVGAQCGHPDEKGAHTGDIGMTMIEALGCRYVLCGHSERRKDHGETDAMVAAQAVVALKAGLTPVVCVGETQAEREAKKEKDVVKRQVQTVLDTIKGTSATFVIAYEPVWAIGTGLTATPGQAQEMHAFIRSLLDATSKPTTRILYGGSLNAKNAKDLLSQPDIDGGLIGGASLKPDEFRQIVATAEGLM